MAERRVTIIVVNWKLKDETAKCLRALERLETPCHVIVIDNGSADGSVEYLASRFPQVELVALPSNVGFGAACNQGVMRALKDSACDYIFLLNNDTVLPPRALSELVILAQIHPQAGILGPKVYYHHPPNQVWYAGARRRWGVLAAADTGQGQADHGQFSTLREVDYVFGAAMFIRRNVLEQVGLFDEQFFLYLEDMDFCLRTQRAGFSLLFVPQVHVHHQVSASTAHNPAWRKYHYVRSTVLFLKKHASPLLIGPLLIFWALVFLRVLTPDLLRGDTACLRAYWSGLINSIAEVSVDRTRQPGNSEKLIYPS